MDLRYASDVRDGNFVWRDANDVAICSMKVIDVEDAAT
jgi:hypothetical protein